MYQPLIGLLISTTASLPRTCVDEPLFEGNTIRHVNPRDVEISGKEFRSFLVGDFGVDTKEVLGDAYLDHYNVPKRNELAQRMKERTQESPFKDPDFVLNVGDSFYPQGVRGIGSGRFNSTFETVFTQPDTYWYTTLGNHEWYGNEKEDDNNGTRTMFRYTENNIFNRWCMPDYNYTLSLKVTATDPEESFTAKIVFMDTFSIVKANSSKSPNPTAHGDISPTEQIRWAEQQLCSSSDFDWRIVVTHYPLITTGPRIRGSDKKWTTEYIDSLTGISDDIRANLHKKFTYDPTEDFRNDVTDKHLSEMLKKCNVDAYISGHEHMTQILTKGRTLMMSYGDMGNGNMRELLTTEPSRTACSLTNQCIASEETVKAVWGSDWSSVFQHYEGAFGDMLVSKNQIILNTIDTNGVVVNTYNHQRSVPSTNEPNSSDDSPAITVFIVGLVLLLLQQLIFCVIYKKHIKPAHKNSASVPFTVEMSSNGELEASA